MLALILAISLEYVIVYILVKSASSAHKIFATVFFANITSLTIVCYVFTSILSGVDYIVVSEVVCVLTS